MKRVWKILGIAALVAVLGTAAVGVAVMAQEGGSDGPFDFAAKFKEALTGILGVSVEEYDSAVDKAQQQVVDEAVTEGWLTEDQGATMKERMAEAPDMGMPGMGRGFGGHGIGMERGDADLLSIAADKLGIELSDLRTELQDGKAIAGLAEEKGVDTQDIVDAYLAKVKENLDAAVADGKITQKQADYQLEQAQERVTDQLDNTWQDRGRGGFPGGGRPGGRGGFPGQGGE